VQPAGEREPPPELVGESTQGWLAMRSTSPGRLDDAGLIAFDLVAAEPLPHTITDLAGEIRWKLVRGGRSVEMGRTRHRVLVTAGPPRRARAWAVTGVGTEPPRPDHNAFTVFRLREAVRIARGAATATAVAERAWRVAMYHYDLSADPAQNPWALLEEGTAGQCMTTGAFIEAVFDILGFDNGRVAYVYPSLSRPTNPRLTTIPHRRIPGAFTVEGPEYDVRSQFRTVAGATAAGARGHSAAAAARHGGAHGIERLKMRDGHGELHNYATAFVVEEDGGRAYFGGGYSKGPYPTADAFLAAACTAVVWAYEEGDSGDWETICDAPDAGYWWETGERFRP
jgi:hypothetical protein